MNQVNKYNLYKSTFVKHLTYSLQSISEKNKKSGFMNAIFSFLILGNWNVR